MCESNVYIKRSEEEKLIFDDIGFLKINGDTIYMRNIFGEEKSIKGSLKEIDFVTHKVIIE